MHDQFSLATTDWQFPAYLAYPALRKSHPSVLLRYDLLENGECTTAQTSLFTLDIKLILLSEIVRKLIENNIFILQMRPFINKGRSMHHQKDESS